MMYPFHHSKSSVFCIFSCKHVKIVLYNSITTMASYLPIDIDDASNEIEYDMEYATDESDIDSEPEREAPDMVDKYVLTELYAGGAFSSVYRGENVRTGVPVAIKTEPVDSEVGLLRHEARMYMRLRGMPGLFLPKWYGVSARGLRCLVLPIGPPSLAAQSDALSDMHVGARIALSDRVLGLLVDALSELHERGVMHRDVKPANVLFDIYTDNTSCSLTIIDLGMATFFPQTRRPAALVGSPAFASIAAHTCAPPAPAQDMESAAYTALFVREGGEVPWNTTCDTVRVIDAMAHAGATGAVWRASQVLEEDDSPDLGEN